jgi:2-polyprenyl-6-methoxyphenol hydroxylase-like FAD-dependent oxidoreductase
VLCIEHGYVIINFQDSRSVLIIGAGVMGLTTALHLAERGYKVTVLEKADHVAKVTFCFKQLTI